MARFSVWTAALMIVCATSAVCAQEIITPSEVKGAVGEFLKVPATTKGEVVEWYALDAGLSIFPVELLRDSKTLVVTAGQTGRYRLLCWTAVDGKPTKPALCTVIVGAPPGPGPGPGPTPGPEPDDPLYQKLKAAANAETAEQKKHLPALAKFWKQAGGMDLSGELFTEGSLYELLARSAAGLFPRGSLPVVQGVIASEVRRVLPGNSSQVLTPAEKNDFKALATKVGGFLEVLR